MAGGTDLPSYYRKYGGFVLSDGHYAVCVYHLSAKTFWPQIRLKYSKMEEVETVDEIRHPIIREAMRLTGVTGAVSGNRELIGYSCGHGFGIIGKLYYGIVETRCMR